MLARPLQANTTNSQGLNYTYDPQYTITDSGYGKDAVKVLHVQRNGPVHSIKEFEVGTHLKLYTKKDFLHGDNSDIIATDSQKNTVYLLAKRHGIENAEKFALLLAKHFISKYPQVQEAHVHVEQYPWQRIVQTQNGMEGPPHNHAFLFNSTIQRFTDVIVKRNPSKTTIISGIKGLRVLKTTQSSFVNFVNDEFRSLQDAHDRIFSTVVDCSWQYSSVENIDFCQSWTKVKNIILKNFAGDPHVGVASPSVQQTLYLTEKDVLEAIPQVEVIQVTMPNKHYFNFDTKPFQELVPGENNEVFIPTDKPHGTIFAQLSRKDLKSHL